MRLSTSFFYTLREDAADEESKSGNLLVRAGMIKKLSAGVYIMLPLGLKAFNKIVGIIREEMEAIDSQELVMPALIPEEVYVDSGRREGFGDSMFALQDRNSRKFVLGPTHEELFAMVAKMHVHSYKDMPVSLYQFQTKYRDEARPRFGLIRVKEFVMKDAYTFDRDLEGLDVAYHKMFEAYKKAFDRMGIDYAIVKADTGVMGGLLSEEFQAISPIGEDTVVLDRANNYAVNAEIAPCQPSQEKDESEPLPYEKVETPEVRTIEEVTAFLKVPATKLVKTLIYKILPTPTEAEEGKKEYFVAICIRGDHEASENKLAKLLGVMEDNLVLAEPEEIERETGCPKGFAGPVGLNPSIKVYVDLTVANMANFVVGANEAQHHLINVNLRDFTCEKVADLRKIQEGDLSEKGGPVTFTQGIEIGNTFKLGTKYSEAMNLYFIDENNEQKPVVMGSYGIGPARCLAAIAEQYYDGKRMIWPKSVTPCEVYIVVINSKDEAQAQAGEDLYAALNPHHDVILDDRNERAGVKFNDSELVGAYIRLTVGKKYSSDGLIEVQCPEFSGEKLLTVEETLAEVPEILASSFDSKEFMAGHRAE